jgi:hypothetical protein
MNLIFVNGTSMEYTNEQLELVNDMVNEFLSFNPISDQEMLETLNDMEGLIVTNSHKGYYIDKTTIDKTAKDLDMTNEDFILSWGAFCLYLIKKGVLQNDNDYGLVSYSFNNNIKIVSTLSQTLDKKELKKLGKECGNVLCSNEKASKKCSVCKKICYCCKECQIVDWKRHKKLCNL